MTEREIFLEALEMSTPEARAAYLNEVCHGDTALRRKVEELLKEHFADDSLLAGPALDEERATMKLELARETAPAQMLGRYKLLEKIGEGGFGEVWMAEQREPVKRRVALKILKPGMDSRQIVARFEAERQALAMMDHANVAKILDAGTTDTGRPYFVMELVRGMKITDYCDQNQLPTEERLKLFILVCQAIQHAHQKGIIHRDIKPSNILVTLHDGVPVPKVIDFGIAKAMQQELTDKTLFTQFQQFIGTPAYISPEQAEMSGRDIDTRADIYSLGVLLYELLVGQTPFDAKEMIQGGLDALRQIIREKEPLRPSTKLNTLQGEARTTAGKRRQTDVGRLVHQLQGDLDWIVMKCLEKDRARRYETANALAADIRRHLENEPVVARPPSWWYEFQKTVRRHKIGFAATGAVIMALAIGLAVATWRFVRERQAYQRAVAAEEQARRKQADAEAAREKLQASEKEKRQNLYVAEMHLALAAWEGGQLGKAMELLRRQLPEPGQEDLRGFEWRLLWQLCQGDALATLIGHKDYVQCLAFSPDGRLFATGAGDGAIKVWDAVTRREKTTLSSPEGIRSLAFSSDGRTLAAGDFSSTLKLWDVVSYREAGILGQLPRGEKIVQFLPDGQVLACITISGAVTLWDVGAKIQIGSLPGSETTRPTIAISPDGKMIAAASGQRDILLWDVATRRQLAILKGHSANVVCLRFSPDGATLASSSADTTIRLWDVTSSRELALLKGHKVWVSSVAFSPDGKRLVSTSVDGLIKLWDLALHTELGTLRGHNAWVNNAVFFPDGLMLVSVSDDRTIKIWDTSSLTGSMQKGHTEPATDFQFLPDAKSLAILGVDGNVSFWDVASGRRTVQLAGRFKGFSESGRLILGERANGEMEVWDSVTRQVITTIHEQLASPAMAVFSPDDRFLACADWSGTLRVWEVATGRHQGTLPGAPFVENLWFPEGAEGLAVAFQRFAIASPAGRFASAAGRLYGSRNLNELTEASTIHPPERFRFWDLQVGRETEALPKNVQRISPPYEAGFSLSLVRDGLGALRAESGTRPTNNQSRLNSFLAGADGKTIIIGGERDITLWDIGTGNRLATLVGHGGWITGLALSPDRRTLASAANDGTLKLWDFAMRKEVTTLPTQISPWTAKVAFARDGNSIAAFSLMQDRRVRFFHAPSLREIEEVETRQKAAGGQQ